MIIRTFMLVATTLLIGCAHTNKEVEIERLSYLADSREDFMLRYVPTGSPCLDALQINLSYAGCSELQAFQGGDELTYFRCSNGSTGATDLWSSSTFVIVTTMAPTPDYIRPICIDPMNALGVLEQA